MFLFVIFIAIPLATLLYFVWVVGWEKPIAYAISFAPANPPEKIGRWKLAQRGRAINWISSSELESRTRPFEDVIVVDLLQEANPRLHQGRYVLIKKEEFCDVLRWLPSSSCVILYGPRDQCRVMVKSAQGIAGHAPIFVIPPIAGF